MANVYRKIKDIQGAWTFHGSDPYGDKSGLGNHLYRQGGLYGSPLIDTVNHRSGYSGCGYFSGIADKVGLCFLDSYLSTDFPCKAGQSNNTFSVTCWFKPQSSFVDGPMILSKYDHLPDKRCFGISIDESSKKVVILWGYNNGSSFYQYFINHAITLNRWYFIKAVWYTGSPNVCSGYLYDEYEDSWYSIAGNPAGALNIEDVSFYLGKQGYEARNWFTGLIQDVCVFKRVLSDSDAQAMVYGTFNYAGDSSLLSRWKLDKNGLGWDTEGNNHFPVCPVIGYAGPRPDLHCALFTGKISACWRADADLSAEFPLKSGTCNNKFTICFWFSPITLYVDTSYAVSIAGNILEKTCMIGYEASKWHAMGSYLFADSGIIPVSTQWYHCTARYNGSGHQVKIDLYDLTADHTYKAQDSSGDPFTDNTKPFMIGNWLATTYLGGGDGGFDGLIGEVIVIGDEIPDDEIPPIRDGEVGSKIIYSKPKGSRTYGRSISKPLLVS